ncbi:MAG: hypothetical protein HY665_08200 [Chloroflexi bacterium]|nr:hypothetical protein [Chloroflexota bacterium]
MKHLTTRVPWHDNRWNGTICKEPSCNSSCLSLKRIREIREDDREDAAAGEPWPEPNRGKFPACVAESGAFMNGNPFQRIFTHPYQTNDKTQATHGCLRDTELTLPPYSALAIPFWWTLRENQDVIDSCQAIPLPPDEPMPADFRSAFVFGRERQQALLKLVFSRLEEGKSLVFFYCKNGSPLGEEIARLVVGVGTILKVGRAVPYKTEPPGKDSYALWDRIIQHSIRPEGVNGFLIPYHDYLVSTGDDAEDTRRGQLLREITVAAAPQHHRTFSYGADIAGWDVALSTLARCLQVVRLIKEHGIAPGPWDRREEWLNQQLDSVWQDRGAFPGLGAALEAMGLRLGTAFAMDLAGTGKVNPEDDPWPVVDAIFRGHDKPPLPVYTADVLNVAKTWMHLSEERKTLLRLLSRFELTCDQAWRWFNPEHRPSAGGPISDGELLANPYLMAEWDEIKPIPTKLRTRVKADTKFIEKELTKHQTYC